VTATRRTLHLVSDRDITLAERIAFHLDQLATIPGYADRALPHTPIVVGCPTCKSFPGLPCTTPNGWTPRNGFHAPRMKAVAGWSQERKLTEYAQMKAAEDLRRAGVEDAGAV
jgi:hypothetical protein